MERGRIVFSVLLLMVLLFQGCSKKAANKYEATDMLASEDPEQRRKGLEYFISLSPEKREEEGISLLYSQDVFLAYSAISLLCTVEISEENWDGIEFSTGDPIIARRFAVLSQKFKRQKSVPRLVSFLKDADSLDLELFRMALEGIVGFSLGESELGARELSTRWNMYLRREGEDSLWEISKQISELFLAKSSVDAVSIVHKLKREDLPHVMLDLKYIAQTSYVEISRELCIVFGETSDDNTFRFLLDMLDFTDYICRYNALQAVNKRTGMDVKFNLNLIGEKRKQEVKRVKAIFGVR